MATQRQLSHTLWPAGEHTKDELRTMAAARGLVTAGKPDSHDVCFIPDGDLGGFLQPRLGTRAGPIVGPDGEELGRHDGAYRFTVGQRRGLGLSGLSEPYYVIAIDGDTVRVGPREQLEAATVDAAEASWVAGAPPDEAELGSGTLGAQVRYRGKPLPCTVELGAAGGLRVRFTDESPIGVAPGQALVLYRRDAGGEECLGGATIHAARPARPARLVTT